MQNEKGQVATDLFEKKPCKRNFGEKIIIAV